MRLDLLISRRNEIGIFSDSAFESPITAIIFDQEKHSLYLEFGQTMESIKCNIPVSTDFMPIFEDADEVFIGVKEKKVISDVRVVPIGTKRLYRNVPLSISEYESFWERINRAQPLHREDLSESELASITREVRGSQLSFTRELTYNLSLQAAPTLAPSAPSLAPSAPKPPGMPPGMGGSTTRPQQRPSSPPIPPTDDTGNT